mmetsp:Transcript_81026/g.229526  ORF Transcript_81026/g.229526 Transcript_81026/m.229526 type:complete len:150 (+) Transcript_81026:103-552(+)
MSVHSCYVMESAVVTGELTQIWGLIRSLNCKFSKAAKDAKREDGADALGTYRITYDDGAAQTVRITEVSERLPTKRSIGLEFLVSDPPLGYSSRMDQICLSAVTHSARPQVYIEYSSDFSSDATMEALEDSKFKKREFFDHLAASVPGA